MPLYDELSRVFVSVDYADAPPHDLSWLRDQDDWPVIQTALSARATTLVTDNATDFPLGEQRNGIRIMGSIAFLAALRGRFPDMETSVREYLHESG